MASITKDAALFYVNKRGWSVLPISPVSKKPLVDWFEFQERLPTTQEIDEWWAKFPNAGVGIITGKISNLVVLDVDTKKGADANYIYRTFPTSIVAQTGSGGGHFYYKHPGQPVPNSVGKKDGKSTGYDIRGDGGYVVAPPSLHPSGQRYKWIDTAVEADPIPKKLLEMVQPKASLNGSAESKEPWLADALRGVGEGARDDTCARLAGYFFSKNMGIDVVLENLRNWNEKNDPPLDDDDIIKVVESVQRTRARKPVSIRMAGRDLQDAPQDPLRLVSLHQYMAQYGEEDVSWAVEGWLPDQTIAMLVSPPGTYKTWVLIDLAVSIATGTPFLGSAKVNHTGPVLVYQQEDFHGQMAQRIGTIMASRFEMGWDGDTSKEHFGITLPPSPPVYFHDNRELRFDNREIMDVMEARIAELRPAVIIVDPLYTAAPMDDYMMKAVPHMMRLKKLRDRYGCSFVIAHHTGKRSDKDKLQREDLWGSQFLNAFLETGWQIRPKGQGEAMIRRHFKVTKDIDEMVLSFDIATNVFPSRYRATLGSLEDADPKEISIINALDKHGPLSAGELAKIIKKNRSTVFRQVSKLITSGAVRLGRDNKYRSAEHFDVTEEE